VLKTLVNWAACKAEPRLLRHSEIFHGRKVECRSAKWGGWLIKR
jgi:hypothetical protein